MVSIHNTAKLESAACRRFLVLPTPAVPLVWPCIHRDPRWIRGRTSSPRTRRLLPPAERLLERATPNPRARARGRVRVPQELELELEETERDYDAALQRLQQYEQASRAGPSRH